MKLLKRIDNIQIKKEYDIIIAWGLGALFEKNYDASYFPIKAVIDGRYEHIGQTVQMVGIPIVAPDILKEYQGQKVLVISYSIYEKQIIDKINDLSVDVDFIIFSLVDIINSEKALIPHSYAKNTEDFACLSLLQELGINQNLKLLEIGVCHPVIRNNTYLFYSLFHNSYHYKGVLVEANPTCWETIEEYRPQDTLIKKGIRPSGNQKELPFYIFPDYMGHSTFDRSIADETRAKTGFNYYEENVPTIAVNDVLDDFFSEGGSPDILSLDAEGLDYSILKELDLNKWRIKVIIIEIMTEYSSEIKSKLEDAGYTMRFKTGENEIWSIS